MAYHVSIFLENKIGNFEKVTNILKQNEINIRSISLMHTTYGWGVLNLLVNQPEKAHLALSNAGMSVALKKVFVFSMVDKPGALNEVLVKIMNAGVNFTNAYGRILQPNESAIFIVDVDDYDSAVPLLESVGLVPLSDEIVYEK